MSTKRRRVIESFFSNKLTSESKGELYYDEKSFKNHYRIAYLTKMSCFLLFLGYFLAIFAENYETNRLNILIPVAITTFLMLFLIKAAVAILMKYSESIKRKITLKEVEELNLQVDIAEISEEEIEEMGETHQEGKLQG